MLLLCLINFFAYSYDFLPNFIAANLTSVVFTVIVVNLYEYDIGLDEAVVKTFSNMIWISTTLLIAHVIITAAGLLFVEAEILRCGNEHILDSLQEGVIILSEDNNEVHYLNRAARNISVNYLN